MSIAESILPEFEVEMAGTRRVLERVPQDKLAWKAHEKSNSIGWVACHLAEIVGWVEGTLLQDAWDINPPDGEPYRGVQLDDAQAIVDLFDAHVATAKQRIAETSDDVFDQSWSLLNAGTPLITMPKLGVIRTWVLNHSIHHRGHLCVYLRLNDVAVPALYGPSGDEEGPG